MFSDCDGTEVSHVRSSFNLASQTVLFQNVYILWMGCKCNYCPRIKNSHIYWVVSISQTIKVSRQWIQIICDRSHGKSATEARTSCALDRNSCLQSRLRLCGSNDLLRRFLMCHAPSSACPYRLLEAPGHRVTTQCHNNINCVMTTGMRATGYTETNQHFCHAACGWHYFLKHYSRKVFGNNIK